MAEERPLSVTEAMTRARAALEGVRVTVVGEVSEVNDKPGYKAAYFTVCDAGAAMPCLMWRDAYDAGGVTLRPGMLVQMTGQFSAYVPKGRMQFVVRSLSMAGEGELRLQVARLARTLELEGLMAPDRKRSLPRYPERIAVVTSPRGKAIHDVVRTLRRRYPLAELLVAGIQVEGDGAVEAIVGGMKAAVEARPDVVLLVRGGGSYEDLMPFNAEEVARAVARCPIPVVTGIGHEPDTSIADMVADLRASTPTAAAEAVAPSLDEISGLLLREQRLLAQALRRRLQTAAHRVARLAERPVLCDPRAILASAAQRLDLISMRLGEALPRRLTRDRERLERARDRLTLIGPRLTERPAARMSMAAARLEDLSPLAILGRGYAVCYEADGRTVVRSVTDVSVGDQVSVRVAGGRIAAAVNAIHQEETR